MLTRALQRFEPFAGLSGADLDRVAAQSRLLSIPGSRWLLRVPARLSGAYFLQRGRLRLWQPERSLSATDRAARLPFYPGSLAVRTQTPAQILQVDLPALSFLLDGRLDGQPAGLPDSLTGRLTGYQFSEERWLVRFVNSPAMRAFGPRRWQQLMQQGSTRRVKSGEAVIVEGEAGRCCYVIKQGRAIVHRGSRVLAVRQPGDYFGEDALIAGTPRNACVTMVDRGELLQLPAQPFLELLVRPRVPVLHEREAEHDALCLLNLGAPPRRDAVSVPVRDIRIHARRLAIDRRYRLLGGSLESRRLCAFLLLEAGFDAAVLIGAASAAQAVTVRSFAQARSRSICSERTVESG